MCFVPCLLAAYAKKKAEIAEERARREAEKRAAKEAERKRVADAIEVSTTIHELNELIESPNGVAPGPNETANALWPCVGMQSPAESSRVQQSPPKSVSPYGCYERAVHVLIMEPEAKIRSGPADRKCENSQRLGEAQGGAIQ